MKYAMLSIPFSSHYTTLTNMPFTDTLHRIFDEDIQSNFIIDVQKCGNPVDIGIALDSSAGVRGRWSYMKNFALSMVDRFQMGNHARFGIVQFDTIAKFPVRMETYNDAETLKVHIKKLLMNPYGKRRTDEALKVARDDLFRTARAGVRRAMIIVTNGRANGNYFVLFMLSH